MEKVLAEQEKKLFSMNKAAGSCDNVPLCSSIKLSVFFLRKGFPSFIAIKLTVMQFKFRV